ncbi:MAG TPA: efflux RND transporter periplasmic adaptor subunit [Xanthobacteraceae bacterium]|nr:efflux RND transporter periplasmic adaptor subunit [Xanthobacteraceae bacterium]
MKNGHRLTTRPIGAERLAAALALGCAVLACLTAAVAAEPGSSPTVGMSVTVIKAVRACFSDTIQIPGTLVPREDILVRPENEGLHVTQLFSDEGDYVKSGQVLARLAPPEGQPGGTSDVTAPASGLITRRGTLVGQTVSPRGEPLFRLVVGGDIELQGDVPAPRIGKIAAGQTARILVPGIGDYNGKVRAVTPEIDPFTQSGRTRITVGSDAKLRIGTFARATVEVGTSCGTSVPLAALLFGPEGPVVQVVRDNRVETRQVHLGLLTGGTAEIREGLGEGDMIVARAGSFLREGDRVRTVLGAGPDSK